MKEKFTTSKVFDGFSTVFRQHNAHGTHCRFLHGYGVSFKVTFEGELDDRNWVWDFGGMKRAQTSIDGRSPKEWMDYMFDHTMIIATDDPHRDELLKLHDLGVVRVRTLPAVGAEKFAEHIYRKLNAFVQKETGGRVSVSRVKFMEHGKNAAYYGY